MGNWKLVGNFTALYWKILLCFAVQPIMYSPLYGPCCQIHIESNFLVCTLIDRVGLILSTSFTKCIKWTNNSFETSSISVFGLCDRINWLVTILKFSLMHRCREQCFARAYEVGQIRTNVGSNDLLNASEFPLVKNHATNKCVMLHPPCTLLCRANSPRLDLLGYGHRKKCQLEISGCVPRNTFQFRSFR